MKKYKKGDTIFLEQYFAGKDGYSEYYKKEVLEPVEFEYTNYTVIDHNDFSKLCDILGSDLSNRNIPHYISVLTAENYADMTE